MGFATVLTLSLLCFESGASSPSLYDALKRLPFLNEGTVRQSDNFSMQSVQAIYLEPEAPTRAQWAWADGPSTPIPGHQYLFLKNESHSDAPPQDGSPLPGYVPPPSGMRSAVPLGGLASGTVELRADGSFQAWTIENASPAGGTKASMLEGASLGVWVGDKDNATARVLRTHPPAGLPGVEALSYSGSAPYARLVPTDAQLPSEMNLTLYARSRWRVGDMESSAIPATAFTLTAASPSSSTDPIQLSLYFSLPLQMQTGVVRSMGSWEPACTDHNGDCVGCRAAREGRSYWAGPCVFLNDTVESLGNNTCQPLKVWEPLAANLTHVSACAECTNDGGCAALHGPSRPTSALACHAACAANSSCASWSWAYATCELHDNFTAVPSARNVPDSVGGMSGVKGTWRPGHDARRCLMLSRAGTHASAGNASLCGSAQNQNGDEEGATISFGTAATPETLWAMFAGNGSFPAGAVKATDPFGAAAVKLTLLPGQNVSLTLSLGWFFPFRDFQGVVVGNRYATLVEDSEAAARLLLDDEAAVADVNSWAEVANVFADTSIPKWFGDSLINTLHHTRSTMWLGDQRWRQWESFSCVNVDSVHNDGERHIPYLHFWPEGTVSKMRAWAKGQQPSDGMIQEQLACGCASAVPAKLDAACGRVMGDVSSMFVVYLLELWQWGVADVALLQELWPVAKRAVAWQLARSVEFGLPHHLVDTYDGLNLAQYNVSAFSAMFHLLALEAASKLASSAPIADSAFVANCSAALKVGRAAAEHLLWNETAGFYRSYTGGNAIMTDSLYAQVLANTLGLGPLTNIDHVRSHLAVVQRENDTPYGFLVQTGRGAPGDNQIWMMGNANWGNLAISLGLPMADAFAQHEKTLGWWRSVLNDMWNVVAVAGGLGKGTEGQPLANSHYGYHMVAWHTLFALTGQFYDATELGGGNLTFSPKISPPFELPVLVPGTVATLKATARGASDTPQCTFTVVAGRPLTLAHVSVDGSAPAEEELPTKLTAGDALTWDCTAAHDDE